MNKRGGICLLFLRRHYPDQVMGMISACIVRHPVSKSGDKCKGFCLLMQERETAFFKNASIFFQIRLDCLSLLAKIDY